MGKIGILGGTFNPPHIGHLFMAQTAMDELKLDKVFFIPSGNPPHKINNDEVIEPFHRLNMTKLFLYESKRIEVLDIEVKADEVSYTVNTLKKLKEIYSDDEIYFILGSDSLVQFSTWKNPEIICREAKLVVANRRQTADTEFDKALCFVKNEYNADITVIPMPIIEVSSTEIRKRVKDGLAVDYMTNRNVENYIISYGLYGR